MNDMTPVIVPKSDQISADDFIAGPATFTIESVSITAGAEQPVSIRLVGEDRVYRPCKSMSRCLVNAWGPDANQYIGRSLTFYRDPKVKWGGLEVGGIRISHMSDLAEAKLMMLTATKGSRKPHKVLPLVVERPAPAATTQDPAERFASAYIGKLATFTAMPDLDAFVTERAAKLTELQTKRPELYEAVSTALSVRVAALAPADSFSDDEAFA